MANKLQIKIEDIITNLPGHVYWKDLDGFYLGSNEQQAKTVGFSQQSDIIGKSDYDFLSSKEEADVIRENDLKVLTSGTSLMVEETVTINGKQVTYISHKMPLRNSKGEITGILGSSIDITHLKMQALQLHLAKEHAEQQEKTTASFLQNIISNLPGHVFWEDLNGIFLGCNDQQAKSIGLETANDLIGKTIYDIAAILGRDKKLIDEIRKNDLEVIRHGKTITAEEQFSFADGRKNIMLSKKTPLKDEYGNCIGILGLSFDITERKILENNLRIAKVKAEKANRAKSAFIANISHDIRTPLHSILNIAELLKLNQHLPEQEEYIQGIFQSVKTLLNLVDNVLDYSQLEENKIKLIEKPFNLKEIVDDTVATITQQANIKGVQIIVNYSSLTPNLVIGDANAIGRILLNLLGNAIKFTKHGHIDITVKTVEKTAEKIVINLIVEDTGIGMPQEELESIFDRFYRITPSYQNKYEGTGLGLSITQKLVDALKGKIIVESELKKGSKFTCTLPFKMITQDTPVLTLHEDETTNYLHNSRKISILFVEDVPLIQKVSLALLKKFNCDVDIASNGAEALRKSQKKYDLIFMDIGLPDEDGFVVIQKIRQPDNKNYGTPIVALTAHSSEEIRQLCEKSGANDFLPKPISYKEIIRCLNKYLNEI